VRRKVESVMRKGELMEIALCPSRAIAVLSHSVMGRINLKQSELVDSNNTYKIIYIIKKYFLYINNLTINFKFSYS
jgi:hypothetical protein